MKLESQFFFSRGGGERRKPVAQRYLCSAINIAMAVLKQGGQRPQRGHSPVEHRGNLCIGLRLSVHLSRTLQQLAGGAWADKRTIIQKYVQISPVFYRTSSRLQPLPKNEKRFAKKQAQHAIGANQHLVFEKAERTDLRTDGRTDGQTLLQRCLYAPKNKVHQVGPKIRI